MGAVIGGAAALVAAFATDFWNLLVEGLESTKSYFATYIEEAGGDVIEGLWNGIVDALKNVGNWIVENIWNPFIKGFKSAFGIHSPSTKMAEMGDYIIEGLWNGIKAAWDNIVEFFSRALTGIGDSISTAWNNIKSWTSTTWSSVKSTLSSTWDSIRTSASSTWSSLKSTVSTAWDNVKSTTSRVWNSVKSSLSTAWNNIKSTASSTFSGIKSTIQNQGWSGVGTNICNGIKNGIDSGWGQLKSKISSVASGLLSAAKSALGIHSPSRLFRDQVGLNIGYGIGEGVEDSEPNIIRSVSGVADAIATEMQMNRYDMGTIGVAKSVTGALTDVSNKITDSFSSLMDRLQAIAAGVTFTAPAVANGFVVPYRAREKTNDPETVQKSNSELKSIFAELLDEHTSAMLSGFEAVVAAVNQKENRVIISDDAIGRAAERYSQRMSIIRGGG